MQFIKQMPAFYVDENVKRAKVGHAAPDFELRTDGDELWRLADHGGRVTVLLFYPEDETLVCTKQLCSVRDHWADYLATKATVVGISPGTPEQHKTFSERRRLPIPLLADPGRVVTRIFTEHWLYPLGFTRGIVVIDAKGVVRNRDVMLRAFRPSDEKIITDIYSARGDALQDAYEDLKRSVSSVHGSRVD